jgi:hypothetical protein
LGAVQSSAEQCRAVHLHKVERVHRVLALAYYGSLNKAGRRAAPRHATPHHATAQPTCYSAGYIILRFRDHKRRVVASLKRKENPLSPVANIHCVSRRCVQPQSMVPARPARQARQARYGI